MPETAPPANPWVIAKLPPNPPASGPRFGPRQAIVALGGFFLLQAVLTAGVLFLRDLALKLAHRPVGMPAPGFLAGSVIAAYVLAAAWAVAYVRRRAGARLRLGAPEGIAWCPAPRRAYLAAAMAALIAVATAAAMLRLFPVPDTALRQSRKPGFSRRQLAATLDEAGILYIHLQPLGTPKPGRDAVRAGHPEVMERIYRAHIAGDAPQAALSQARAMAGERRACLLCFEHDQQF